MSEPGRCDSGGEAASSHAHPEAPPRVSGIRREPGGDDLQGWLLRAGLVFVFSYAAVSACVDPSVLAGYLPAMIPVSWTPTIGRFFAGYELVLVAALLTRRYLVAASVMSAATLVVIVAVNPSSFEVLFRNVAIICAALALALHAQTGRDRGAAEGNSPGPG